MKEVVTMARKSAIDRAASGMNLMMSLDSMLSGDVQYQNDRTDSADTGSDDNIMRAMNPIHGQASRITGSDEEGLHMRNVASVN
jgi:hypothetical protein